MSKPVHTFTHSSLAQYAYSARYTENQRNDTADQAGADSQAALPRENLIFGNYVALASVWQAEDQVRAKDDPNEFRLLEQMAGALRKGECQKVEKLQSQILNLPECSYLGAMKADQLAKRAIEQQGFFKLAAQATSKGDHKTALEAVEKILNEFPEHQKAKLLKTHIEAARECEKRIIMKFNDRNYEQALFDCLNYLAVYGTNAAVEEIMGRSKEYLEVIQKEPRF